MSALDDEDDEQGGAGSSKYPVMPSLVALQQMKNRLHLAYLGKKLMKWTALATGRDLRKLAENMIVSYEDFKEDVGNAFMCLARARYFYPNLNKMVIENFPKTASVLVKTTTKSSSGVRVIQLEIIETDKAPYEHLGIEKGGQAITEAKAAWLDLLKRKICILELRTSFLEIEVAHKNATKRQNVLQKLVIPRITASIKYILLELEELAREELYRIKMVKVLNMARAKKKELSKKPIPQKGKKKEELESTAVSDICVNLTTCASQIVENGVKSASENFEFLHNQINKIIALCKNFIDGILPEPLDYPYTNKQSGIYCNHQPQKGKPLIEVDEKLKHRLDHLKAHLREVIDVTREFRNDTFLTPSVENFVRACEEVDNKLNIYRKTLNKGDTITEDGKNLLFKLKDHVGDVAQMTEEYKKQGLLTASVENFLTSCDIITNKIEAYTEEKLDDEEKVFDKTAEKLDDLKQQVANLEQVTVDIKKEGIASSSIEKFLASCKDFKKKLDSRKMEAKLHPEFFDTLKQIDNTIELSKKAKRAGLVAASVDDFIESCETTKKLLETNEYKVEPEDEGPTMLDKLTYSIDDAMKMITKYKDEGLTESVDEFLKSCVDAKAKIDLYKRYSPDEVEEETTSYSLCTCDYETSSSCCISDGQFREGPVEKNVEIIKKPSVTSNKSILRPKSSSGWNKKVVIKDRPRASDSKDLDSRLGCIEKKTKTITTINRTQNLDGTIKEEKETTTIKKERYDPDQIDFSDDDLVGDISIESVLRNDSHQCVLLCQFPVQEFQTLRKSNVLDKVILPRIISTIKYILSELEEKEREEIFRLKRFKQLKTKRVERAKTKEQPKESEICEPCPTVSKREITKPVPEPETESISEKMVSFASLKPDSCERTCSEIVCRSAPIATPTATSSTISIKVALPVPIDVCCSCLSLYESDPNTSMPMCSVCKKAAKVREKSSHTKVLLKPCNSADNKKRLEGLTTHIDEVINLTKQYKTEGIVSPSIEKFIQTCNSTKERIENYANKTPTCDCRPVPETVKCPSASTSFKSVASNTPDRPTEEPAYKSLTSVSEARIDSEELGYFESKYKEVVKITRLQNEDGTISEERQIVTIKTERKTPRKSDRTGSNYTQEKFVGSCTCHNSFIVGKNVKDDKNYNSSGSFDTKCLENCRDGGVSTNKILKIMQQTKSEGLPPSQEVVEPKLRSCISAGPEIIMGGDVVCTGKICLSIKSSKEIPLNTNNIDQTKVQCPIVKKAVCPTISIATATDNPNCCLTKKRSICSENLKQFSNMLISSVKESVKSKASEVSITKPNLHSEELKAKKVTLDKATYCMPNCFGERFHTVGCSAIWRDVSTSTTDINFRIYAKVSSNNVKKGHKNTKGNSDSCCRIKIIIKPQSKRKEEEDKKITDEALNVTSSIIDALTKFVPSKKNETTKRHWSEVEDICSKCIEKIKNRQPSCSVCQELPEDAFEINGPCENCMARTTKDQLHKTPEEFICRQCQDILHDVLEKDFCKRCLSNPRGIVPYSKPSEKISTCKLCKQQLEALSVDICKSCLDKINNIALCQMPSEALKVDSAYETNEDIENSSEFATASHEYEYGTSMATDTNTCVCKNSTVSSKSSKGCLRGQKSKVTVKSQCCGSCSESQDAWTLTKRCNRFDVRPIGRKHTSEASTSRTKAPKKSHSYH